MSMDESLMYTEFDCCGTCCVPKPKLKIKLSAHGYMPEYAKEGDSGMDLKASCAVTIPPGERSLVPTGVYIQLPEGFEGQVRGRSGLALRDGISVLNSPGTIDQGYRGELGAILMNNSIRPFSVLPGMRIAQLVICPVTIVEIEEVAELDDSERGEGGFGSTGII